MSDFSDRIRNLAKIKGLSVRRLADRAELSPGAVQRAMNAENASAVHPKTLRNLASALDTTTDFLMFGPSNSGIGTCDVPLDKKYNAGEEIKSNDSLAAIHGVNVGSSLLNAKRKTVTEDTMEPEIAVGDDVLFVPVEEDCQDMAKTKDIVFGVYKETGREALVRLRRDGDTMWGVIENRDFPGDRQRELSLITGIVVCAIKWYKRPSNMPPA